MSRLRPFVFPLLLTGLVALAGVGVWQVVAGRGEADQPSFSELSPEEQQASRDASRQDARDVIQDFVVSSGDPCTLPSGLLGSRAALIYSSLAALVNDSGLIVLAEPASTSVLSADPGTVAGAILVNVNVVEVFKGVLPADPLMVSFGAVVMSDENGAPRRVLGTGLDPCTNARTVLFLSYALEQGFFAIDHQRWASIDGTAIRADGANGLFNAYTEAGALLAEIRQIVEDQEAQDLARGLVACEDARASSRWISPIVCPGESFNPYEAYSLDTVKEANLKPRDSAAQAWQDETDLATDPRLQAILRSLNFTTVAEPLSTRPTEHSQDELQLSLVVAAQPGLEDRALSFGYSPAAGTIRLPSFFSGEIQAPPGFKQAIQPFLVAQ